MEWTAQPWYSSSSYPAQPASPQPHYLAMLSSHAPNYFQTLATSLSPSPLPHYLALLVIITLSRASAIYTAWSLIINIAQFFSLIPDYGFLAWPSQLWAVCTQHPKFKAYPRNSPWLLDFYWPQPSVSQSKIYQFKCVPACQGTHIQTKSHRCQFLALQELYGLGLGVHRGAWQWLTFFRSYSMCPCLYLPGSYRLDWQLCPLFISISNLL